MAETMTFPYTRQGVRNLDAVKGRFLPISGRPAHGVAVNVGDAERLACAIAGGLLGFGGLARGGLAGLGVAALGGALLTRGLTGHCVIYQSLGYNTAGGAGGGTNAEIVRRVG